VHKRKVVAIGLDACDPVLIEKWIAENYLKNLAKLKKEGSYSRLKNYEYFSDETPWTNFITGCLPNKTGFWTNLRFLKETYDVEATNGYDFKKYPQFYALGHEYRVAIFDVPHCSVFSNSVNGVQVIGWGSHSAWGASRSKPENLLKDIIKTYGENPVFKIQNNNYWWDVPSLINLRKALLEGLSRRTAIYNDLLNREKWDLFLTVYSEPHIACHHFWHISQSDHPLHNMVKKIFPKDPLREVYEAIDESIGKIVSNIDENTDVLIFSVHGSTGNYYWLPTVLFLGEFIYRFNFPGRFMFESRDMTNPPPSQIASPRSHERWIRKIWESKYEPNSIKSFFKSIFPSQCSYLLDKLMGSPFRRRFGKLSWQPVVWYKEYWRNMKAFALPSHGDGNIRINLKGREPNGLVPPSEYNRICDEIVAALHKLKDARTDRPIVKEVIRTRKNPLDESPTLPDADLLVLWERELITDVVDSPDYGRIGPVLYERSGGHLPRGFLIARGPSISSDSIRRDGQAIDLAPTIRKLIGAPIPEYYDGKPLFFK